MRISQIFEELYAGKSVTLSFPSVSSFNSFHSQLRVAKSRYEHKFQSLFGESLTAGQVIRVEKLECTADVESTEQQYTFTLGPPKPKTATTFTIIRIEEPEVEQAKQV